MDILSTEATHLSEKPRLGKNRPGPVLVWKNPKLSAEVHREKSKAKLSIVSGQTLYTYVLADPINLSDPLGLWSVSLDFYFGWGGAFVFGKNPDGSHFIDFRGGYGAGGGVSYDPKGTSPGFDCNNQYKDYYAGGAYGGVNAALGPLFVGYNGEAGLRTEDFTNFSSYSNSGLSYGASLEGKWGLRLGGAVGVEAAAVDYHELVLAR